MLNNANKMWEAWAVSENWFLYKIFYQLYCNGQEGFSPNAVHQSQCLRSISQIIVQLRWWGCIVAIHPTTSLGLCTQYLCLDMLSTIPTSILWQKCPQKIIWVCWGFFYSECPRKTILTLLSVPSWNVCFLLQQEHLQWNFLLWNLFTDLP